jgi:hypothetical protein
MSMSWRPVLIWFLVLLGPCAARAVETGTAPANPRLTGTPFMQVWRAEDYGASPVNWRVLQDPASGFIYVGNGFGVLEFDGASWRLIPLPREGAARSIAIDQHGTIWAAGTGDICRLVPDATGTLRAVDMVAQLPVADRVFGVINRAVATRDGIYFAGQRRIFLFREDGAVRVWRTEGNFSPIWETDDTVHVARDHGELVQLQPDGGTKVLFSIDNPDEPLLRAYSAARAGRGWILLSRNGPARWDGVAASATLLAPESVPLFTADPARTTLQLADGRFAFGSVHGAMILSSAGRLEQRFDVTHGLPVDTINGLAEDREGGLWIAMQNGIARIQLDSPFAAHGLPQGLDGGPRRLARFNDRLYVAHGGGLSWRNQVDGYFELVRGLRGGANRPVVVNDRLLVTTGTALREVSRADDTTTVAAMNLLPLIESKRQPGWLLAGDADSVWLFSPLGAVKPGWKLEGPLVNLHATIVQLYDSGDGFTWAVTDPGVIWRMDFRRGLRLDAPCEQFDAVRGVPDSRRRDHVQMFLLGPDLYAASTAWLLRYDAARERFAPATGEIAVTASADAIESDGPDSVWLHRSQPDSQVLRLTRNHAAAADTASLTIQKFPAAPVAGMVFNSIFHEAATHTLWLAGQGSLVSMDLDWHATLPPVRPTVAVRKISTLDGAVLEGGAVRPARGLSLSARQNALRIEFGSPTFTPDYVGKVRTLYRTRIDGLDANWSRWSPEPFRDVTNLPYRGHVLHVQAQAGDGRMSEEATLAFVIAPPWWLTAWAFASYSVAAAAALTAYVAWRTKALRARAVQLEALVVARTAELADSNRTLAGQNAELTRLRQLETEEKIAARLAEEKARLEVLRYQLNPHFLFNALTSICAQLPPELAAARTTIERLTDFCESTLFRPSDGDNPTLADEMRMLRAYLDIEQTRWGELLAVEIEVAPEAGGERIPPFLLLALVENALKYGRATNRGAMKIRLAARRESEGALLIEVANTGEWAVAPAADVPSLSIGLENLRQRLQRFYPGAHDLVTTSRDGWVRVLLSLRQPRAVPVV